MKTLVFDVFGKRMLVERRGDQWLLFELGGDGKRRPADVVIPGGLGEHELAVYLGDLFHEHATERHSEARLIR